MSHEYPEKALENAGKPRDSDLRLEAVDRADALAKSGAVAYGVRPAASGLMLSYPAERQDDGEGYLQFQIGLAHIPIPYPTPVYLRQEYVHSSEPVSYAIAHECRQTVQVT